MVKRVISALTLLLPLFAIVPEDAARAADLAYDSGGSGAASRYIDHALDSAVHGRYTEALSYDNRALAISPSYGEAYVTRAHHYMDMGRYDDAQADIDRVLVMHPDDMALSMTRADLALRRADGAAAIEAVKVAMALPLRSYWHNAGHFYVSGHMESYVNEYVSIAQQLLHNDDESLASMQRMLKLEYQYPERILANYCYRAAIAGLLETAELACQQSIAENSHDIGQYDSLGYVHLRMKRWDKAIADYNKALDGRPDLTVSLYGRGIAKRARGDIAGGNADIAAATRNEPDIATIMQRLSVGPA